MRVRINDVLIFDEDTMSLSPINSFLPTVKLGSIHTRCFAYLCRKKISGEAVASKKELFYEGWEKHGLISSDNSLAQTIFQIRKALCSFNLADSIGTIPRVGFSLRRVNIEMVDKDEGTEAIRPESSQRFWKLNFLHSQEPMRYKKMIVPKKDDEEMTAYLHYSVSAIVIFTMMYRYFF